MGLFDFLKTDVVDNKYERTQEEHLQIIIDAIDSLNLSKDPRGVAFVLEKLKRYFDAYGYTEVERVKELHSMGERIVRLSQMLNLENSRRNYTMEEREIIDACGKAKYAIVRERMGEKTSDYPKVIWEEEQGYKAMSKDMTCKDFQYEIGKTYKMEKSEVSICSQGFHFSPELEHVFRYYQLHPSNRFFKVRGLVKKKVGGIGADGSFMHKRSGLFDILDKYAASEIEILEEVPLEELKKYIQRDYPLLTNLKEEWKEEYVNDYTRYVTKKYGRKIAKIIGSTNQLGIYIFEKCFKNDIKHVEKLIGYIEMLKENNISLEKIMDFTLKEFGHSEIKYGIYEGKRK